MLSNWDRLGVWLRRFTGGEKVVFLQDLLSSLGMRAESDSRTCGAVVPVYLHINPLRHREAGEE